MLSQAYLDAAHGAIFDSWRLLEYVREKPDPPPVDGGPDD